ncbi:MAG: L-lactate dehydrogenase [Bacillota bacterium]
MDFVKPKGKVVVVGSGFVGASSAFALTMSGLATEIVLIDINKEKAQGEALDLNHGLAFAGQMSITSGDYDAVKDADIIIITAGAARKPGQTRLDLAKNNANIIKDMVPKIMQHYNGGVIVVVSNPVDILTYLVQKISGLPEGKVFGSGTVLDSSRFRYLLSQHCNIDVKNIHGYIIGEHGDAQIPVWSATNIAGQRFDEFCSTCTKKCGSLERQKIAKDVKESGSEIIKLKGATYYAIAFAVNRIVEAILKNQNSIITVSSVINGSYGISDVALSLPSIVNSNGIERIFEISLEEEEYKKLHLAAEKLKETIKAL